MTTDRKTIGGMLVAVLLVVSAVPMYAQNIGATVEGLTTDERRAVLPGVTVTISNVVLTRHRHRHAQQHRHPAGSAVARNAHRESRDAARAPACAVGIGGRRLQPRLLPVQQS